MFIVNSYQFASVAPSLDPDAQAFLTATAITDPTIVTAIDTLVKDLKAQTLWNKFKYIYPFVGGTATTNKFNLKDPQDLDASFRLTFFGGVTHTNGFNPNGTNGYANTFCAPSLNVTLNSEHLYLTSNTNNTPASLDSVDTGAFNGISQASLVCLRGLGSKNSFQSRMNGAFVVSTNTDAIGSFCATKTSTDLRLFKNAILTANGLSNGSLSTRNIFIGTLNLNNTPYSSGFTNQNYTFATYGDGLTDIDVANLTTIEQAFNTTLGR